MDEVGSLLYLAAVGLLTIEPADHHTMTLTLSADDGTCRSLSLPDLVLGEM